MLIALLALPSLPFLLILLNLSLYIYFRWKIVIVTNQAGIEVRAFAFVWASGGPVLSYACLLPLFAPVCLSLRALRCLRKIALARYVKVHTSRSFQTKKIKAEDEHYRRFLHLLSLSLTSLSEKEDQG
jgi:hypothetical protein